MGQKENAKLSENTGGQLKYMQTFIKRVTDSGADIDFTSLDFELNRKKCNHLEIFNSGPDKCVVGFDTRSEDISCTDRETFSFTIYSGKPFNYISLDGEADSISFKALPGKTAQLEIIVW